MQKELNDEEEDDNYLNPKKLKERIADTWFADGYESPLSAALANPDLLSDSSRMWQPRGEIDVRTAEIAKAALSALNERQKLYINFKMNEMSIRQMARVMGVHRSTAQRELDQAVSFLRETTEKLMRQE